MDLLVCGGWFLFNLDLPKRFELNALLFADENNQFSSE